MFIRRSTLPRAVFGAAHRGEAKIRLAVHLPQGRKWGTKRDLTCLLPVRALLHRYRLTGVILIERVR